MTIKIEIFFSYAHEDEALREELGTHLRPLAWQGMIIDWYDRKIGAGSEWAGEVDSHLNTSHIILLLVSPDFMASGYCHDIEVKRAMERHEVGEARVIPIILRPADWEWAFGKLKALPKDGKPIKSSWWHNPDEAFLDVARGIRQVVEELRKQLFSDQFVPEVPDGISEKIVDSYRLYNSLIRLNYREQALVFQQFKDQNRRVGGFLIYGAPSYGQAWLLNRLLTTLPNSLAASNFKFSFERKACGRSLKDLWRELAKWVGLKSLALQLDSSTQKEIVKRVYRLWQRNTVILILSRLYEIDEPYLNEFMQDFWLPLVEMTRNASTQSSRQYLLLFLIDNANSMDNWHIPVARQFDRSWEPQVIIKLERLTKFSRDVLADWIEYEFETLPLTLTAQDILVNSEAGIPEFVLDHVCALFGYDWLDLIKYRM